MFQKLHRQLTFFCTVITGTILVALSLVCLLFAKKAIVQTGYTAFQKELVSVITSIQSQEYISHQWLKQMQAQHHFIIYLYDNEASVYYDRLQDSHWEDLRNAVLKKSGTDIFNVKDGQLIAHKELTYRSSARETYYASVGYLLRGNGQIRFVILYDTSHQTGQIAHMTIGVFAADLITFLLLILFSWFFTGRMVQPLEISQKKQQQFVAAASHELRSPLTVMLSGLETVEKSEAPTERHHFLSLIRQEGLRMQHLIADMLLLANADARGISLQINDTAPDDLLLCVYEKYENLAASKGISLQFSLGDAAYRDCALDTERITQVLSILMDNALSYTPQGEKSCCFCLSPRTTPSLPWQTTGLPFRRKKKRIFLNAFIARTMHILTTITLVWAYAQHRKSFVHITERFWYTIPVTALRCLKVFHGIGALFLLWYCTDKFLKYYSALLQQAIPSPSGPI